MQNLLPLDRLRESISYNPFHFWQLADDEIVPVTSACNTIIREFAYQSANSAGRNEIRTAIAKAEDKFHTYLGFWTRPVYVQETIQVGCFLHFNSWSGLGMNYGFGGSYNAPLLELANKKIRSIGTEVQTLIGTASVSYDDLDGDDLDETFVIDFSDSTSDPSLVQIAFQSSDCLSTWTLDQRFIAPVTVTRTDASTLQVSGPAWLMVPPKKYSGFGSVQLDPTKDTTFAAIVELYLTVVSAANAATLNYFDSSYAAQTQALTALVSNPETGLAQLYSPTDSSLCGCSNRNDYPQTITINYRAGADPGDYDEYVVHLALAELRTRVCACEDANKEIYSWQLDLAMPIQAGMHPIKLTPEDNSNPIGTRAGQIEAWHRIQALRVIRGLFV
jgi:hypothetical protein